MLSTVLVAVLSTAVIGVPAGIVIASLCCMSAKCEHPPQDPPDTDGMGLLTFRDVGDDK